MSQKRKLSVQSVNKIKYENLKEFGESIFREVYQSASRCVAKIIEDNAILNQREKDGYFEDEQLSNVVAFLGERGMGKSSAMLSYSHFLKTYEKEKAGEFKINNAGDNKLSFLVLPRIDTAMIGGGESILDVILATMWDKFYEREKQIGKRSNVLAEEVREDFNRVKNTYRNYKKILLGNELLQDMASVRELHELAACINLRSELKKLLEDYLAYENDRNFLVICLDDLDMTMGDLYESIEQIRLFLMIPKVIILSTINLSRFMMSCQKYLWERLSCNLITQEENKKKIDHYAKDYAAKILPSNMRINMPYLGMAGGVEYEIELDSYLQYLHVENIPEKPYYDERKLMFTLFANYLDIFFLPYEEERHFLQDDSLRAMVNKLHILLSILKEGEDVRFELAYRWYFDRLAEYGQSISNTKLVEKFLRIENRYINGNIVNILLDMKLEKDIEIEGEDYGDILRYLLLVEGKFHREVFNFVTLFYSIQICSGLKRGIEKIENICKGNIFYASLSEIWKETVSNGSCLERRRSLGRLLDTELIFEERKRKRLSVAEIINRNARRLIDMFIVANFCGFPLEEIIYKAEILQDNKTEEIPGTGNKQGSRKTILTLKMENNNIYPTISIDNFICNILKYKKNLTIYIKNIYRAIALEREKEPVKQELSQEELEQILEDDVWKYKKYEEWKTQYNICEGEDVREILPIQSVELMVYLARNMLRTLRKYVRSKGQGITFKGLKSEWDGLVSDLREVEEFCSYKEVKGISYAERLDAYWKMLSPQDIGIEIREKLDIPSERIPNRPKL